MQFIPGVILSVIVVGIPANGISIVPQAQILIIERLGRCHATWDAGVHLMTPFVDHIIKRVDLRERVADFPPQPVVMKGNVTMRIDPVAFFVITEPKLYAYGIENSISAIENLTATTLRDTIGSMDLDTALTSHETINTEMRSQLDVTTDPWNIKVGRVELENILPPDAVCEAMKKQMEAEREERELIILARGKKESAVLNAQGNKEAAILNAETEKQTAILRAEAEEERKIQETEGQAKVIRAVKEAEADDIRPIREVGADEAALKLCSLDTLARIADSRTTKIVVPPDIQNMAGLVTALKEAASMTTPGDRSEEKARETDLSASSPRRRR